MGKILRPSDMAAIIGGVHAVSQGVGSAVTGWLDMSKFDKIMAVIDAGVLGANATLEAKIQQATSVGGAGAKDIAGKAITQLTKAGADDNKWAVINLQGDDLDVTGGVRFVQLSLTVATAASLLSALVLGFTPRYAPASDNDAAAVDEIVA
jgi:hypothetical protein